MGHGKCPRCGGDLGCQIMSMFNTEMICCDCKEVERQHPRYKEAVDADIAAMKVGNYNFVGIGKPEDL